MKHEQNIPPAIERTAVENRGERTVSPVDGNALLKVVAEALNATTVENRRRRRWNIFFKFFGVLIFLFVIGSLFAGAGLRGKSELYLDEKGNILSRYTAVVDVKGMIADGEAASAELMIKGITKAFKDKKVDGIILRINSGGGSPVQSGYVYDEITRLRGLYPEKPIVSVIEEIGASGAYYIAAATENIYADKASLVGSIGVTAAGFGFDRLIEGIGVDRRLYTSGEHKAFLDPFSPEREEETQFWSEVLGGVHQQFITAVKEGRGDRLDTAQHPELFSGLIWNGEQALQLGLIDGLGSAPKVAREIFKSPYLVDFTEKEDPFGKLMKQFGASVTSGVKEVMSRIEWR